MWSILASRRQCRLRLGLRSSLAKERRHISSDGFYIHVFDVRCVSSGSVQFHLQNLVFREAHQIDKKSFVPTDTCCGGLIARRHLPRRHCHIRPERARFQQSISFINFVCGACSSDDGEYLRFSSLRQWNAVRRLRNDSVCGWNTIFLSPVVLRGS